MALYLRASSHLAEVKTRYRDRHLEEYLTRLVARAHTAIYGGSAPTLRGAARTLGRSYREAVRDTAAFIAVAAILLLVIVLAVDLWVAFSREARAGVLPPAAREAIERAGGGRADLGAPPAAISTLILVNNVQVALLAFALGITAGIGTVYVLVQNAVFIGALAGGFQAAGHAGSFWALVLPHGFLEITAIAIAAGAGLRMGWALVDPGERRRGDALAEEARGAVLVVVGVVPAFAVAAFIEGFVTGSALPDAFEIGLGAAVAAAYLLLLFGRVPARYRRPNALMRR